MDLTRYLSDPVIAKILPALHPINTIAGEDKPVRSGQRQASVMIPLFPREAGWTVLLTQRPETMPSHAGIQKTTAAAKSTGNPKTSPSTTCPMTNPKAYTAMSGV